MLNCFIFIVKFFNQAKESPQKIAQLSFKKTIEKAMNSEWEIVDKIIKTANYNKKNLNYVENKIKSALEIQTDKTKSANKRLKISAFFIAILGVFIFIPRQPILDTISSGNTTGWTQFIVVLSALSGGIFVIYEWLLDRDCERESISYKMCLHVLEQAQLRVDNMLSKKK